MLKSTLGRGWERLDMVVVRQMEAPKWNLRVVPWHSGEQWYHSQRGTGEGRGLLRESQCLQFEHAEVAFSWIRSRSLEHRTKVRYRRRSHLCLVVAAAMGARRSLWGTEGWGGVFSQAAEGGKTRITKAKWGDGLTKAVPTTKLAL